MLVANLVLVEVVVGHSSRVLGCEGRSRRIVQGLGHRPWITSTQLAWRQTVLGQLGFA